MAESKNNLVTHGLSGKLGNMLVFSQRAGKTVVGKVPRKHGEATVAQSAIQAKFQQAVIYAKAAISESQTKANYAELAKNGNSAYTVAIADFFNAPDIAEIDISHYTGVSGGKIRVKVVDDFIVENVSVSIINGDGTLVEEGNAIKEQDGIHWSYTATQTNSSFDGDKISVTATDKPGNVSTGEVYPQLQ
jgi:hypothetical protein